jgi:hypothetical protein
MQERNCLPGLANKHVEFLMVKLFQNSFIVTLLSSMAFTSTSDVFFKVISLKIGSYILVNCLDKRLSGWRQKHHFYVFTKILDWWWISRDVNNKENLEVEILFYAVLAQLIFKLRNKIITEKLPVIHPLALE